MSDFHPADRIEKWMNEAREHPHIKEPTAMALATSSENAMPSVRMVLCKEVTERGVVFYTNNSSQKGMELSINPHASVCFYWMPMMRQIRVTGNVTPVNKSEANEYFASRTRGKQIGAHASDQSQPLKSYEELLDRTQAIEKEFEGMEIPRPPYWSGWRIALDRVEFWQEGKYRLHEREVYVREAAGWNKILLNP